MDNDGGARQGGWGVRYNKLTEMATDDAKPWINEGGSRNGRGRGSKQLTKMSTGDAKPWVNEGRSRKGRGREWNTNLTIMDADDTKS